MISIFVKLAATSTKNECETKMHVRLVFEKTSDILNHFKFFDSKYTQSKIRICFKRTYVKKREFFKFFFQKEILQQGRGLVWPFRDWSGRRRRKVLIVLHFVNQNRVLSPGIHVTIDERWNGKWSFYPWSKDCIFVQVKVLPVALNVHHNGDLISACIHISSDYTWEYSIPHLHSLLLVGVNWESC